MNNYDIGILTFWGVPNYGTFAQAYALQKVLQKLAGEERSVVQINHLDLLHYSFYYNQKKFYLASRPWKRDFWKGVFLSSEETSPKEAAFLRAYETIPHSEQITRQNVSKFKFNKIFLGSDIIWDYSMRVFHNDPLLFGVGFNGEINSYAASFGTIKTSDVIPEYVATAFQSMTHISVRDKNSADLVYKITGKEVPVVLDPTWLWDFHSDSNIIDPDEDEYILVYGQDFTPEFVQNLRAFSRDKRLKIIVLDCNEDKSEWCDKLIRQAELSPFEWIGYFKNATYVATSTFHGIMFSLIFNKHFAFCKTDFIMAKVETFLEEIGILSIFDNKNDAEGMLNSHWDYEYINEVISVKKKQSFEFLYNVIGE